MRIVRDKPTAEIAEMLWLLAFQYVSECGLIWQRIGSCGLEFGRIFKYINLFMYVLYLLVNKTLHFQFNWFYKEAKDLWLKFVLLYLIHLSIIYWGTKLDLMQMRRSAFDWILPKDELKWFMFVEMPFELSEL